MRYVLMCKEREVLRFDIDLSTGEVHDVEPLEGAALAPLGILVGHERPEATLSEFLNGRHISNHRADLPMILEATGAHSPLELAFRGNGFSLSDPYWYRAPGSTLTWAHGNYFHNDWDHAFGDAVLRRDYAALQEASPATPDVTCAGSSRKAWFRDARGTRLLKADFEEDGASTVAEALTSRMLARLLPEDEFVSYELVDYDGMRCSASSPIVDANEELSMGWQVLMAADATHTNADDPNDLLGFDLLKGFARALSRLGVRGSERAFAKMMLIAHLTLNNDMHPRNLGTIRSVNTRALRLAPLFDFDRMFGLAHRTQMQELCARPQVAALLIACRFSTLDPSLDYSWYDPHTLDGFEDEIARTLSACDTVPNGYARILSDAFASQRAYVNSVVG